MSMSGIKITDVIRSEEMPMDRLEILSFSYCDFGNRLYKIIDQCEKLVRLEIMNCKGKYNWLTRKYPTLEYFKFGPLSEWGSDRQKNWFHFFRSFLSKKQITSKVFRYS